MNVLTAKRKKPGGWEMSETQGSPGTGAWRAVGRNPRLERCWDLPRSSVLSDPLGQGQPWTGMGNYR